MHGRVVCRTEQTRWISEKQKSQVSIEKARRAAMFTFGRTGRRCDPTAGRSSDPVFDLRRSQDREDYTPHPEVPPAPAWSVSHDQVLIRWRRCNIEPRHNMYTHNTIHNTESRESSPAKYTFGCTLLLPYLFLRGSHNTHTKCSIRILNTKAIQKKSDYWTSDKKKSSWSASQSGLIQNAV